MMKSKRKPLRVLLAGLFCSALFAVLPMTVFADDSGICGDGVEWEYTASTHTLRIYGSGEMYDFNSENTFEVYLNPYYQYLDEITSVVIEDGVTRIGEQAFNLSQDSSPTWNGAAVQTVTMADSVTSIGAEAFKDCHSLSSVTLSNGLKTLGVDAFCFCSSLPGIELPDSLTTIGDSSFYQCTSLETVSFPSDLTAIGDYAFYSCIILKAADLSGTKVTKIGDHAFDICKNLGTLIFPDTLKTIGISAFSGCEALTAVSIPASVTRIEEKAFLGDTNISEMFCYPDPSDLTWVYADNDFITDPSGQCYIRIYRSA